MAASLVFSFLPSWDEFMWVSLAVLGVFAAWMMLDTSGNKRVLSHDNDALSYFYDRMPSLWAAYIRLALCKKRAFLRRGESIPRIELTVLKHIPEVTDLVQYRSICEFPSNSPGQPMPVGFLHAMSLPAQLTALASWSFPLKLSRAVHRRSHIIQHESTSFANIVEIRVVIEGHRVNESGDVEVDVRTAILPAKRKRTPDSESSTLTPEEIAANKSWRPEGGPDGRRIFWEEVVTLAFPVGASDHSEKSKSECPSGKTVMSQTVSLEHSVGRRFGWLTGNFKLAHFAPSLARLCRRPGPSIQDMYLVERALCEAERLNSTGPLARVRTRFPMSLEVVHVRPVPLPAAVSIQASEATQKPPQCDTCFHFSISSSTLPALQVVYKQHPDTAFDRAVSAFEKIRRDEDEKKQ